LSKKRLDKDNIDEMVSTANEVFEGVEIQEEDFLDQFDSHVKPEAQPIQLTGSNRILWTSMGEQCNKYDPCPICFKCRVKASHLFAKCDECEIPICVHTNANRELMIRRKNFTQEVGSGLIDELKKLENKYCSDETE
jgi:hypothetical protein